MRIVWLSQRCHRLHWLCIFIHPPVSEFIWHFDSWSHDAVSKSRSLITQWRSATYLKNEQTLGYAAFLTWILRFLLNGVLSLASSEYWHIIFIIEKECHAFRCLYLSRALTIYFGHMLRDVYCLVSHLTIMWKPRRPRLPRSHTCTTHTVFNF